MRKFRLFFLSMQVFFQEESYCIHKLEYSLQVEVSQLHKQELRQIYHQQNS